MQWTGSAASREMLIYSIWNYILQAKQKSSKRIEGTAMDARKQRNISQIGRSLAMSPTGAFDIHEYIPYLVNRAAIVLVEQFQTGLKQYDLTRSEWRVMAILSRRGPTRFGALASLSALEPPTLSRVIAALVKRGLAIKSKSGIDARGVVIEPNERARALVKKIVPHAMAVEQVATRGLSEDEARFFLRLLQRICDNLSPWVPDSEARD
jgi:DNA-binding MarR family transcriptional regulator